MVDSLTGQVSSYQARNVDLSAYADQVVTLRFAFVSDALLETGPGWNLDDVRVAEP